MKYLPACPNFSDALIIRCTTDLMISFLEGGGGDRSAITFLYIHHM